MSKLLSMMMSGKKVEFKNYIYQSGSAYINLPLFQDIKKVKLKANCTGTTNNQFYGYLQFYLNNSYAQSMTFGIRKLSSAGFGQISYKKSSSIYTLENSATSLFEGIYELPESVNATVSFICVGTTDSNGKNGQTYYIELYNSNNENICSLYPAIVNEESGLYDKTNKIFYGNSASSGSLICV